MKIGNIVVSCAIAIAGLALAPQSSPSGNERAFEDVPAWHGSKDTVLYRSAPGAEIRQLAPDRIALERGEAVFEPEHPVAIVTPLAEAHLVRKAAVLFRVQPGSERLMVLWDKGDNSVTVICKQRRLSLGSGNEVLIADHAPNYHEVTEPGDIGRRRIKLHTIGGQAHAVTSEFSLMQALERDPLLYDLSHSKEPRDRALTVNILKTATVLNMVTAGHGYYSTTSGY